jgi:hypothetical protein
MRVFLIVCCILKFALVKSQKYYILDDSTKVKLHFKKGTVLIGLDFSSFSEDNREGTVLGWQNRAMPKFEYYLKDKLSVQSGVLLTQMLYTTKKEYDIITTDAMFGVKYDVFNDHKSFVIFLQNLYLYGTYSMLYNYQLNNDFGKKSHKMRTGFGAYYMLSRKTSIGAYYYRHTALSSNPNYNNYGWVEFSVRYFLH